MKKRLTIIGMFIVAWTIIITKAQSHKPPNTFSPTQIIDNQNTSPFSYQSNGSIRGGNKSIQTILNFSWRQDTQTGTIETHGHISFADTQQTTAIEVSITYNIQSNIILRTSQINTQDPYLSDLLQSLNQTQQTTNFIASWSHYIINTNNSVDSTKQITIAIQSKKKKSDIHRKATITIPTPDHDYFKNHKPLVFIIKGKTQ